MKVNVVMLVCGRWRLTGQAIESLRKNTPRELFNLTLVDDVSVKERNVQTVYGDNETSVALLKSKGITGQARNLGVYWAEKYWGRGDYLYLSDNDVYFTPGWLEKLIDYFRGLSLIGYDLIGGWNHPFLQPTFHNNKHDYASHDAVAGASQLMRWEPWDKFGPLDSHAIGVGQSEDWKFCQDIIKDGGKVGSIYPRVVLNCGVTNSFGVASPGADVMVQELVEAKKTYPDLYWE